MAVSEDGLDSWFRARLDSAAADWVALVTWLHEHEQQHRAIERFSDRLAGCLHRGGRILACGNGGSMCDAMHFAEELSGRHRRDRRAFAVQALSDPAYLTCVANDWGFERVFARGVEAWGQAGDVLLLFSTSGNSRNLIAAAETAQAQRLEVLGLLGGDGGRARELCDLHIIVPSHTPDRIQELHIKIGHLVVEQIEHRLASEPDERAAVLAGADDAAREIVPRLAG